MSRFPMNRYDEQRLIQEVHYLHSLWHQGPPRPHHHPPIPTHPPPYQTPIRTPVSLQPSSSTQFKKRKKKNPKRVKKAIIDSGIEWPCPKLSESSPVTESGWGSFTPQPNTQPHLPTAEELANFASNQAQQPAIKAVSEFLKYSVDAEDDEDDDEDEEKGVKNYEFFVKLFEEDDGLREYYEKNKESGGEFSCLVCCGVGKKGWRKRFKDCVALVQHSVTIANTNMRHSHRAYGQVVCKILGWDITWLPSIVLTAVDNKPSESSDKLAEISLQVLGSGLQTSSLVNSNDGSNKTLQGNEDDGGKDSLSNTTDTVYIGNDELSQLKQSFSNENQQENGGGSTVLEQNSPIEASVNNCKLETAKENTEGASNCPGNEGDGGKNGLSGQSNMTDSVNIGSNELSQQKEPFGNENQQENGGGSTALENNFTSEANANRSLEDVSNDILETAKENAEGASNCPEPMQEDTTVVNEENNCQKDDVSKETTMVSDMS
ncbi:hypothetical protein K7X08_016239 [Anisodus acutangulus]|uniref:Uncharacterized protein n=1 Tax=Anisodus acutangulus TaxID=402998 RepID=A0A9Q1QZV0_9SOLA|nr:hypothetical protein K7X08_016239 [Anisodus acutangulus]